MENESIKSVTIGTGGQTPKDIGWPQVAVPEKMRQGYQYDDSIDQYLVAKTPYLVFSETQREKLNDLLQPCSAPFKEYIKYLSDHVTESGVDDFFEKLQEILRIDPGLTVTFSNDSLQRLLDLSTSLNIEDLLPVDLDNIDTLGPEEQAVALDGVSTVRLIWRETTPEGMLRVIRYVPATERFNILTSPIKNGKTALELSVWKNPELLKNLLNSMPIEYRLNAIMKKNYKDEPLYLLRQRANASVLYEVVYPIDTIVAELIKAADMNNQPLLHAAAKKDWTYLMTAFDLYSKDELVAALSTKDSNKSTPLDYAASNIDSLTAMLKCLSESQALAVIKGSDTLLRNAAKNIKCLNMILDYYPKEERLGALMKPYDLWDQIEEHDQLMFLDTILSDLSSEQHLALINTTYIFGKTLCDVVSKNAACLARVLDIYPKERRCQGMFDGSSVHQNAWSHASNRQDVLEKILNDLTNEQRLEEFKKTYSGNRLLDFVAKSGSQPFLEKIISMYPPDQRLEAIMKPNDRGETILYHVASHHKEGLNALLNMCPQELRLGAMFKATVNKRNVWDQIADTEKLEILNNIVERLNPNQRLEQVMKIYDNNQTVLHLVANDFASLKKTLSLLSEDQCLETLMKGMTVLHRAANNIDCLKELLAYYPKERRLDAMCSVDKKGKSVWHCLAAIKNPEYLPEILAYLPEEERLQALLNDNLMDIITQNASIRCEIMALLPKEHRLAIMVKKDSHGENAWQSADNEEKSTILSVLLSGLTQEQKVIEIQKVYDAHEATRCIFYEGEDEDEYEGSCMSTYQAGSTILHLVADNAENLAEILAIYPQEERLNAVLDSNLDPSVWQIALACTDPTQQQACVRGILNALTDDQQFELVKNNTLIFESALLCSDIKNIILNKMNGIQNGSHAGIEEIKRQVIFTQTATELKEPMNKLNELLLHLQNKTENITRCKEMKAKLSLQHHGAESENTASEIAGIKPMMEP